MINLYAAPPPPPNPYGFIRHLRNRLLLEEKKIVFKRSHASTCRSEILRHSCICTDVREHRRGKSVEGVVVGERERDREGGGRKRERERERERKKIRYRRSLPLAPSILCHLLQNTIEFLLLLEYMIMGKSWLYQGVVYNHCAHNTLPCTPDSLLALK